MSSPPSPFPHAAPPAWHVLGAGAIGGLWALRLAARGLPVRLVGRNASSLRTLTLQDGETVHRQGFPQLPAGDTGVIGHLLVTTKSHATREALIPLLPALARDAIVVLLQNGMGAENGLLAERPDLRLLVAITTDGVYRPAPDTLVLAGRGETHLGALRATDTAVAARVARELGMDHAPDIRTRRWLKLAMNCAINPLTALLRCRNGELLAKPEALATMRAVCAEVAAVMVAEGLAATPDALFRQACVIAEKTGANLSSMRVDIEDGRRTEIHYLNGYVAARGHALGIPTPANDGLLAAIEALS